MLAGFDEEHGADERCEREGGRRQDGVSLSRAVRPLAERRGRQGDENARERRRPSEVCVRGRPEEFRGGEVDGEYEGRDHRIECRRADVPGRPDDDFARKEAGASLAPVVRVSTHAFYFTVHLLAAHAERGRKPSAAGVRRAKSNPSRRSLDTLGG